MDMRGMTRALLNSCVTLPVYRDTMLLNCLEKEGREEERGGRVGRRGGGEGKEGGRKGEGEERGGRGGEKSGKGRKVTEKEREREESKSGRGMEGKGGKRYGEKIWFSSANNIPKLPK